MGSTVFRAAAGLAVMLAAATSDRDVVRLAAEYVAGYQQQLTEIVADEEYAQSVRRDAQEAGLSRRSTSGEVFFIFSGAGGWMAIRDVQAVNGVPVTDRTNVREILGRLPPSQVADRMRSYNSRFNIGRITRNINEPTLALLSLDAEHRSRFRFSTKSREVRGGRALVWVAFQERDRPTLIRGIDRTPVYMKGELLVEAANGRIWQSRLTANVDRIKVELTTHYELDERLGLLLPTAFREHYERDKTVGENETIDCEAKYSNFRRFEVSTRIR